MYCLLTFFWPCLANSASFKEGIISILKNYLQIYYKVGKVSRMTQDKQQSVTAICFIIVLILVL